jgi:hypothetical protein
MNNDQFDHRPASDNRDVHTPISLCWENVTNDAKKQYQTVLDVKLENIPLPLHALNCKNPFCKDLTPEVERFHDAIVTDCIIKCWDRNDTVEIKKK